MGGPILTDLVKGIAERDSLRAHRERLARMQAAAIKGEVREWADKAAALEVAPIAPVIPKVIKAARKSTKAVDAAFRSPSHMVSEEWDDARTDILRREWNAGVSIANIAAHLETTENAIRGKAYRLDLPLRPDTRKRGPDGRFCTDDGCIKAHKHKHYYRGSPRLWFTPSERIPLNGHWEKARAQLDAPPIVAPTATITMHQIIDAVCSHFRVSHTQIRGDRRSRFISQARQVSYWLCAELTRHSFPAIGRALGKDHSSIIAGIHRVMVAMESNESLREELDTLRRHIISTARQRAWE